MMDVVGAAELGMCICMQLLRQYEYIASPE